MTSRTPMNSGCPFDHSSTATATATSTAKPTEHNADTDLEIASAADAPWVDFLDPEVLIEDPYPLYARLRAEAPVSWSPGLSRYFVSTYEGCHTIEHDQETFSSAIQGTSALMLRSLGGAPMLRKDDPDHAAERAPINPPLRPRALEKNLGSNFRATAEKHLAAMIEIGPDDADLDRDYSIPVATQNLIDIMGLQGASIGDVKRWSQAWIDGTGNILDDPATWQRALDANSELDALLDEKIPHWRAEPDGSVASALVNSDMSDESLRLNMRLAISGGLNEPQHVLSAMVSCLDEHPNYLDRLRADPALWSAAFDETVRWLSPIGMYMRQTTRDTILQGYRLPKGAQVGVLVSSANRDEKQFAHAHRWDLDRSASGHLGFGNGVHLCAGHWAGRISIGKVAVPYLYENLPGLRVDQRRGGSTMRGWVFRGTSSLPVTWAH